MKKSKKPSKNGIEASPAIEIAPEALANLVDKLKSDLANPNYPQKQLPRKLTKEKKAVERRQADANQNGKKAIKGPNQNKTVKSGKAVKGPSHHAKKDSSTGPNSESRAPEDSTKKLATQNAKQIHKFSAVKSKVSPKTSVDAKDPSSKGGKVPKGGVSRTKAPSLLEDILSLGGTKEDLELVEDIDSEEDIIGGSQAPKGQKLRQKNDEQKVMTFSFR